jgi:outer membrane lipoprotein-sorting protein
MKLKSQVVAALFLAAVLGLRLGVSQSNRESASPKAAAGVAPVAEPGPSTQATPAGSAAPGDELKTVLAKMNQTAPNFKSLKADFEWENFDKLIKETDVQRGQAYFRRKGKDVEALFVITAPAAKQVLYSQGTVSFYEPKINRITERDVGKNKSDVEAFMSLGLGGSGDDLANSFNVTWQGWETVDGVKTAKLEVAGKSPSIQKVFSKAVLWIDPERDVAIQQQFFQKSGDYRLTRYHNIKFNEKMSDSVFRLKTTGTPEKVRLRGD